MISVLSGDPGGILTHDLQNRNLTFYTAELRSLKSSAKIIKISVCQCGSACFFM